MNRKSEPDIETDTIIAWWRSLYPNDVAGRRGDAGARAAMRRAENPVQALMLPACHDLFRALRARGMPAGPMSDAHIKRIAMAAAIICSRGDSGSVPGSLIAVLGRGRDNETPLLSPLRFQSLMAAMDSTDDGQKMTALRRALSLARNEAFSIQGLVRDILRYSDSTRIRWTFDYYGTNREVPDPSISGIEERFS